MRIDFDTPQRFSLDLDSDYDGYTIALRLADSGVTFRIEARFGCTVSGHIGDLISCVEASSSRIVLLCCTSDAGESRELILSCCPSDTMKNCFVRVMDADGQEFVELEIDDHLHAYFSGVCELEFGANIIARSVIGSQSDHGTFFVVYSDERMVCVRKDSEYMMTEHRYSGEPVSCEIFSGPGHKLCTVW